MPTLNRTGQANGAGDDRALYLKQFAQEVITQFRETFHMDGLHMVKDVSAGKSWQFPVFGKATSDFYVPGTEIDGQVINQNEKEIFLDEMQLAAVRVADIDAMLEHYDSRSVYSAELAQSVYRNFEHYALRALVAGGKASSLITGGVDATEITLPNGNTALTDVDASDVINALFEAGEILDGNDVPREDRYALIDPATRRKLVSDTTAINRDWGGVGSFKTGEIPEVNGIKLIVTNNLPRANYASNPTGAKNSYVVDASDLVFPVFHKTALASVRRMNLTLDTDWIPERRSWLIQAVSLTGTHWLRPEAIVNVNLSAV